MSTWVPGLSGEKFPFAPACWSLCVIAKSRSVTWISCQLRCGSLTNDNAIGSVQIDDGLHVDIIIGASAELIFSLHENN